MLDPYRMFVVNIAVSTLLLSGCLIYRYIYPRKKINLFSLLIIVSLLPLISLLRKGVYESGDFNLHLYRAIPFYENLKVGNLMPSWGGDLNATYGYPVFIFNYILHYYVIAFFHFLGFSFISSMKLFLALSYVFSGIFMYLWAKNTFKNDLAAFSAAIIYQFMPYHLVVLHYRVNGENFAYLFLPLLLYVIHRMLEKPSVVSLLWTGLIYGLFFYAHSAIAVFASFIVFPYVTLTLIKEKKLRTKKITYFLLACLIGLALANPVFVAHLMLSQYTYGPLLGSGGVSYTPLTELLYSPWRYGLLFQGPNGELSFLIGYTQVLVLFISFLLLVKTKKRNFFHLLWFALAIMLLFLIIPQSLFLWKTLPTLSLAQFTYRLLLLVTLCVAMLAGYIALRFIKYPLMLYVLVILTVGYTMLNWGNRRTIPEITDTTLRAQLPTSTANYEGIAIFASPKWLSLEKLWETETPKKHIEILRGRGEIKQINRDPISHKYITYAINSIYVKENTLYFPNWKVFIDKKEIPINYQNPSYPGIITFDIPNGLHHIEIIYSDEFYFAAAKKISIAVFIFITLYISILYGKKYSSKIFLFKQTR